MGAMAEAEIYLWGLNLFYFSLYIYIYIYINSNVSTIQYTCWIFYNLICARNSYLLKLNSQETILVKRMSQ